MRALVDDRDPNLSEWFLRKTANSKGNEEQYCQVHLSLNVDALRIIRTSATIVQDKLHHPRLTDGEMVYLAFKLLFDYNAKVLAKTTDPLEVAKVKVQLIHEMQEEQNRKLGEAMQADQKRNSRRAIKQAKITPVSDIEGFKSTEDLLQTEEKTDKPKEVKPYKVNELATYKVYKKVVEDEPQADFDKRMSALEKEGKMKLVSFERENRKKVLATIADYEQKHSKKGSKKQ
jgi:hypothetical protein